MPCPLHQVIPAGTTVQKPWAASQLYTTLHIADSGITDYNRSANVVMHPCHATQFNSSRKLVLLPTLQTRVVAKPVLNETNLQKPVSRALLVHPDRARHRRYLVLVLVPVLVLVLAYTHSPAAVRCARRRSST